MKKYGVIIKEVAICLAILIVVVAGEYFLFSSKYPKDMVVPEAAKYTSIEREKYKVVGDIQDAQNATEVFDSSTSELEEYQTEYRYVPGTTNPFQADQSNNDLPSEYVSTSTNVPAVTED